MARNYTLRAATLEDLPTLREFEQGVVDAERDFTSRLVDGEVNYYDLNHLIQSDKSKILVAIDEDDQLVACGYARLELDKAYFQPRPYAYLGFMYVVPAWRGRGVIQAVIDALLEWGREQGISTYKLDVFAGNQSAIRAYEKLGFVPEMMEMIRQE